MVGNFLTSGLLNTLNVNETFCKSLDPVVVVITRGSTLTSNITAFVTMAPKVGTFANNSLFDPFKRSNITARLPQEHHTRLIVPMQW